MSSSTLRYDQGATKPDAFITCTEDAEGLDEPVDLSTGYSSIVLRVGRQGVTLFEETVEGTETGVAVDWSPTGGLSDLDPGAYVTTVVAVETGTGEARKFTGRLVIRPALPAL